MPDVFTDPELPIVRELGESLLAAAQARDHARPRRCAARGRRRSTPRLRRRVRALRHGRLVPLILTVLLALTAVALAAGGVIQIGSPARPTTVLSTPSRGLGVAARGSVRLLPLRVSDPAGEPPWGMRVLSTSRGLGCAQVGRVVDDRLGVLGQDRAFHNDGRFHELPADDVGEPLGCSELDAAGRTFLNVVSVDVPASGWNDVRSCDSPVNTRGESAALLCAEADERILYYGLLGPQARSVSYTLDGHTRTVATVGPEGAYLIVLPAAGHDTHGDFSTSGNSALLNSSITKIEYRDGSECRISRSPSALRSFRGCPSVGYTPLATPTITRAVLASPVHVRLSSARHGHRRTLLVQFRARLAVSSARSAYMITLRRPNRPASHGQSLLVITRANIARGSLVRRTLPATRPGLYSGTVVYVESSGPQPNSSLLGLDGLGRSKLVGRFRIRIRG